MSIEPKILLFSAVAGFALIMLGVVLVKRWRVRFSQTSTTRAPVETKPTLAASDELFGAMTPALAQQIPVPEGTKREMQKELRRAGYYRPTALREFNALRFVLVFATLVLTGLLAVLAPSSRTRFILLAGLVVAGLAFSLPRVILVSRGTARTRRLLAGLPDAIDLVNMGVSRGMTFPAALQRVQSQIREVHSELSRELEIVQQQARLGTLGQALRQLEQRIEAPEVRALTSMLTQSERLGTSLAASLETSAGSLRTAMKNHAERTASSAPFKLLFPVVLCLLPAVYMLMLAPAVVELSKFLRNNNGAFRNRTNLTRITPDVNRRPRQ